MGKTQILANHVNVIVVVTHVIMGVLEMEVNDGWIYDSGFKEH